ncbi:outer membrane protein assembly factor BamB family protein [Rhodobium gokarnense]|uniref:Outer membrane protein assembly factor BamB n=1 Tax=Rhodobium gokarnense TaxID=364296 RepID=A0ABT3HFH8_9HYPH|nr:PQQ-binding-like beta-propeller repeat protein [Rhodobium gokarnense]MCW2309144.1 outer membrane protein assembly factor BamB [Rhodobium gokarnense]
MASTTRRGLLAASLVLALGTVAGCSSLEDLNPFHEKEEILPGERHTLFEGADPVKNVSNGTASIGGARDLSQWPQSGGDAANNPGNVAVAGGGGRAWRVKAGSKGLVSGFGSLTSESLRVAARPIVYGGRIFTYDPNGQVTALSTGGGRAWSVSVRPEGEDDNAAGGGLAADSGRIYAATAFGQVVALDAGSGQVLWRAGLAAPARSAPAAVGGKVFVVTQTNQLYALNQADGEELWTYRGIPNTGGVLSSASPAVSGDTAIFPSISGEVIAMSIAKGEPKWTDAVSRSYRIHSMSGLSDVSASPVIAGGTVYTTGIAGRIVALNLSDGSRIWEQGVGSVHTPVVSGNAVFLVDLEDRAVALDRSSGKLIWATQLPRGDDKDDLKIWAGPVLAGGRLWFASNGKKLVAVNATNGSIAATTDIGEPTYISPIAANGTIFVLSGDGTLTAFR